MTGNLCRKAFRALLGLGLLLALMAGSLPAGANRATYANQTRRARKGTSGTWAQGKIADCGFRIAD